MNKNYDIVFEKLEEEKEKVNKDFSIKFEDISELDNDIKKIQEYINSNTNEDIITYSGT